MASRAVFIFWFTLPSSTDALNFSTGIRTLTRNRTGEHSVGTCFPAHSRETADAASQPYIAGLILISRPCGDNTAQVHPLDSLVFFERFRERDPQTFRSNAPGQPD